MVEKRSQQRFENYHKAVHHLKRAIEENANTNSDLIKEGIIQRFEITHELAWKLMKDILIEAGERDVLASRIATKRAYNLGLINQGEVWMEMIESCNRTAHTYNELILETEFNKIIKQYLPLFIEFEQRAQDFL
ncbi:nucleotidyltransferase substrate binding protein [Conservatibacter flavescens]|uniref:Nucleotidyltransferase n=1 Tax=Conservatibacter flavescens TaxID=28161 RepID=A0A2M8S4J4_9PAST|nr:nucleotidyltransferase substrate binding protein [Conservatibacter flavescens]PJG86051.1 nucleotidyltransferase [Conservatibacter flavescens]